MSDPTIIKKYGNRRLYDTGESRYVTLDELAQKIRGGTDVRVVDAKSGEDLTQTTLTQIVVEGRGAARLLPIPLLTQLVRLGDDALAEFFGRYVSVALDMYLQARRGASAMAAYNPFATVPFATTDAMARLWGNPFGTSRAAHGPAPGWPGTGFPDGSGPPGPPGPGTPPQQAAPGDPPLAERSHPDDASARSSRDDMAELRREIEELKRVVREGGAAGGGGGGGDGDSGDGERPRTRGAAIPAKTKAKAQPKAKAKTKAKRKQRTRKGGKS